MAARNAKAGERVGPCNAREDSALHRETHTDRGAMRIPQSCDTWKMEEGQNRPAIRSRTVTPLSLKSASASR